MKIISFFKSTEYKLYMTLFTVAALTPNVFYVFHSFSVFQPIWRVLFSGMVALIVAGSIMNYTLDKNIRVARYYMLFEVSISAFYYITTIGWDWGLIPAFSFTLMLPLSLEGYASDTEKKSETPDSAVSYLSEQIEASYKYEIVSKNSLIRDLQGEITELKDELSLYKQRDIQPLGMPPVEEFLGQKLPPSSESGTTFQQK